MPKENMTQSVVDPAVLNDPELIRKRKEARRNMSDVKRQEMLSQVTERAMQEAEKQFRQETIAFDRKRRAVQERLNRVTEKSADSADK